jgi:type IV pilus assembly protein PilW
MPLLVHAGAGSNGSDVLAVYTGASGLGEAPMRVRPGSATGTGLRVSATVGLRGGDLGLVVQDDRTCLMQQVESGFVGAADQQLNFSGTYAASVVNSVRLDTAGAAGGNEAALAPMGNVAGNRPSFVLMGVGPNDVLMTYDLLRLDGADAPVPMADGVADLRVLYGVDTSAVPDGVVDEWVAPTGTRWGATALMAGTDAARDDIGRILAVRVGVLLRNSAPERNDVSPSTLTLFGDLGAGLSVTRTLTAVEQKLRWRSMDFTVPLRNVITKLPV